MREREKAGRERESERERERERERRRGRERECFHFRSQNELNNFVLVYWISLGLGRSDSPLFVLSTDNRVQYDN